ncbi:sensor domain-containing protein [Luteimonas vadosa]|uniref:EAL domain-containing protein n=1 Tax=Luteimonas vadosa TaxID=1165507 RepID=A0ABP9E6Z1_9GAMM
MQSQEELEFHRAYDRVTEAYIALDTSWRYTHVNTVAARMLGRNAKELIGRHVWTEFPTPEDDPFRQAYETAMAEQRAMTVEAFHPPRGRWFENRIYPSPDGLTVSFLDVTDRRRAEILAAGQNNILAEIATQAPLADSLRAIARLHEALDPGALCSILLVDDDRTHVLHGAGPSLPDTFNEAIHGQEIGDARGSCGTAIFRRERVVVAEIATHPYWAGYRDVALAHGLQACWSTPVLGSREQVLGSFAVYYREKREPRPDELESIEKMLSITAIAIESDQMLQHSRERDYFFDMSMELYCIYDIRTQRIIQANPTFTAVTGYSAEELGSCHFLDFVHPEDLGRARGAAEVLNAAGMRVEKVVYRFRCKDGSYRWLSWESIVGPGLLGFAVAHDVTEHRIAEAALAHADTHDGVTDLPNRQMFELALESLLEGGEPVWVLLVGLDRFHAVNESLGHLIGDEVLKIVADRLAAIVGARSAIARFAGDQFAIAIEVQREPSAEALARRVREAIAHPVEGEGYRTALTASVGIARSPDHGEVPSDLLRRAEAAMDRVKRQGRDDTCLFTRQHMKDVEHRLSIGHRLRGAAGRGEMELFYQPQLHAGSRELIGFEALIRWNDPERGRVSPLSFIPVAEALGLMPELGRWIVGEACRQAKAWRDEGFDAFAISINVSMQELQSGGLVAQVADALDRNGLPPSALCIELTESSLMENVERVRGTLSELKALGTHIALDDFGTGYSSLAYLKHFPIDKLKIDQSFVKGLPGDVNDAAIARTIVAMAHQLEMLVSAEGVENDAQATFLTEIGCDELQGYHFGRPCRAGHARAWLSGTSAGG